MYSKLPPLRPVFGLPKNGLTNDRVATHSGKQGKQGKWWKKFPCREKSGNLKFCWKSGKNQGISKNLIFVRSKYSNFIAVQMWLLVVSFCHMLKIPADLILLKVGVLVRWSTCLLYILFFSSPEQKLRVSYCHHPMSVVRRSSSTISLLTL